MIKSLVSINPSYIRNGQKINVWKIGSGYSVKPGFDDMFSSCGKKNMWKCACVVLCSNDMVKAYMVSEFSVICFVVFA